MECIYCPELDYKTDTVVIENEEFKHLRALRLKEGSNLLITNGRGLCAESKIDTCSKSSYILKILDILENFGELPHRLCLAIGILSDRNRLEFALEKAVELGITDFIPLITDFTEKNNVNSGRLRSKAVAAMKQCKRSILPKIWEPRSLNDIEEIAEIYDNIILADMDGLSFDNTKNLNSTMILVGPEGGFSPNEIIILKKMDNILLWNLGSRRLRAETAAISALSIANAIMK